jgi:hypothetical protein
VVFAEVKIHNVILWVMTPCFQVGRHQSCRRVDASIFKVEVKMESVRSSETWLVSNHISRYHDLDDRKRLLFFSNAVSDTAVI